MTQAFDICIRGGGIVGSTLALLLARERLHVALVANRPTPSVPALAPDVRAYALNAKSRTLLESLRCWPEPQHATTVAAMQVWGDAGGEVNFSAAELGVAGLAWIVDVPALEAQLAQALRFQPLVEMVATAVPAQLTVICEGKASRTRDELGVDFDVHAYAQTALAARLQCELAHGQTARQWFGHGEILALLPLDGAQANTVAMVWSVEPSRANDLLNASAEEFCQQLGLASGNVLGQLDLLSARSSFPLQLARARNWVGTQGGNAWALAGDAAHNLHPLSGQGLNLGLADAQALAAILHQREYWRPLGDLRLLRRYQRSRQADTLAMLAGTDALQRLFSAPGPLFQTARNWGMKGFEHSGPLKAWLAQQAMGL